MKKFLSGIGEIIIIVAVALLLYLGIRHFIGFQFTVRGASMNPTTEDSQHLIVSRLGDVDRFDIVVLDAPDNSGDKYIKRVIGMPGDKVEYRDNQLYINDQAYNEPYLNELKAENPGKLVTENFTIEKVPEDSYFVMGDNRPVSKDSRAFGPVAGDLIYGEVNWRIWPFDEAGRIE
ncbi:signal peptidase I [Aerococcus mictus]|uniref:signal peptidase I n=1 Tax=Aerococcus mictus TaxID=2976810 RepID=UPI000DCEA979|nr:signal peptidase I [Aerococcus mictus]RAV80983.1 signal peptidase I [Aerococcus mictus]